MGKTYMSYLPQIIGLCAQRGIGKSRLAKELVERYGYVEYAFAQPLKEACKVIWNFDDDQLYGQERKEIIDGRWGISPRHAMQFVGEIFRNQYPTWCESNGLNIRMPFGDSNGFWLNHFQEFIRSHPENTKIVVSDVRYPNEGLIIRQFGGDIVRIIGHQRDDMGNVLIPMNETSSVWNHESETSVNLIPYSHKINNNGTVDDMVNALITVYAPRSPPSHPHLDR